MDEWEPVRQRARKCSREEEQCVRPQHPEETPEGWRGSVWYVSRGGGCPRRPRRDEVHLDQDGGRATRERPADLAGSREFNQQGEVTEKVVMCVRETETETEKGSQVSG